jgi:hypothetical protein
LEQSIPKLRAFYIKINKIKLPTKYWKSLVRKHGFAGWPGSMLMAKVP